MAKSDNGELNNSNLASNNSDPNNSLLQKVTKRVSGLFPSSITKWFGPSDGSTSVIRRRDTEDDDDQLQIQQPPKKRAKPTTSSSATVETDDFTTSNHFQMTSTPLMSTRLQQAGPSNYTRHTISTVLYDTEAPSTSTSTGGRGEPLLNGDDKSDDSGESTNRGHSSNQPTPMMTMSSKESTTPSPNKSLNTSRSLFSEQSLNPQQRQCLSSRRPSFNSSTFGSPTFMDRTLSTRRAVNSPFYGGRTIYGGASAYKRNRIVFPRDEANNLQVKNSVSIKPRNDQTTNENVSLSKTARRILDTLEHFSTPVLDAKKIPNINRQKTQQRVTPYAREHPTKPPPTRELIIPTVPDLLKMKQKERLQNSTEQVRKLATTSKSVLNEYSIRTLEDETTKPQKHTTKIKAKIATVREKKDQLSDTVDAVQLPEIKLPITNLPKFDFTLPPPPKPKLTPEKTDKPENKNDKLKSTINTSTQNKNQVNDYKFAKPIVVKSDMPSIKSINHFKFSEPIDAKKPKVTVTVKETAPSVTFKAETNSTAPRKKDTTKNNGQQNDVVGFSLKPPEKLVEGSVMDILGKPDPIMDKFKPQLGTWECVACMVRNIPSATRCVACETLKEPIKKVETQKQPTTSLNSFGNQFKMSAEKWECGVCMVRNDTKETKCVACTTPRSSSGKVADTADKPATSSSIFGGFGDKFKPAADSWECEACLLRNKQEAVKCLACETPKPGSGTGTSGSRESTKPSLIMNIAPTPASSSGFGDFIKKQQTNWECPSCMVRNPPEKKTCVCCEAPKPGEKQEFSFGSSGPQFKFGIDKSSTTGTTTSGFSFGIKPASNTTSTSSTVENSTPTGFTFGVPKTESHTSTAPTFSFGLPATTTPPVTTTPSAPATNLLNGGDPKKIFSFGTQSTATTSTSTAATPIATTNLLNGDPKKMFSFGTQSTTITSSTPSTTKPPIMFNPLVTPAKTESNSAVSSTSTPTPAPTITTTTVVAPSPTFSFGTTPKPIEEKKPHTAPAPVTATATATTPQFNFGSGSLPFNPVFGSASNIAAKTTNSFVQPTTNFLTTSTSSESTTKTGFNTSFAFKPTATTTATATTVATNNNKTEVKPFSFTSTPSTVPKMDIPKGKFPEFTFNPLPGTTQAATTATPLSKAPVINFASNDAPKTPQNNLFSFGATKTENKTPSFGGGGMFGQQPPPQQQQQQQQQQSTPQNGGFNFGATAVTPNFNFGAAAATGPPAPTTNSTTPVFGFGSSQAGSGSATAASTPGVFTFGGGPPAAAAFTPDIKPNFNFTGGTSITSFTGQGGPSATMPQRKIRKAVRRTQPR